MAGILVLTASFSNMWNYKLHHFFLIVWFCKKMYSALFYDCDNTQVANMILFSGSSIIRMYGEISVKIFDENQEVILFAKLKHWKIEKIHSGLTKSKKFWARMLDSWVPELIARVNSSGIYVSHCNKKCYQLDDIPDGTDIMGLILNCGPDSTSIIEIHGCMHLISIFMVKGAVARVLGPRAPNFEALLRSWNAKEYRKACPK